MLLNRVAQRGSADAILGIRIRAFGEQQLDQAGVTGDGGQMQRGLAGADAGIASPPVLRLRSDVFGRGIHRRPGGQEGLGDRLVAFPGGEVQRR